MSWLQKRIEILVEHIRLLFLSRAIEDAFQETNMGAWQGNLFRVCPCFSVARSLSILNNKYRKLI